MKQILVSIFCFQLVFTVGSCQKPNPPEPPKSTIFPTNLEVLWNAPFHSDSTEDYFWDYEVANILLQQIRMIEMVENHAV